MPPAYGTGIVQVSSRKWRPINLRETKQKVVFDVTSILATYLKLSVQVSWGTMVHSSLGFRLGTSLV